MMSPTQVPDDGSDEQNSSIDAHPRAKHQFTVSRHTEAMRNE